MYSLKDIEQSNSDIGFELRKIFDFAKEQQETIDELQMRMCELKITNHDLERKAEYWKAVAEGKQIKINP